MNSEYILSRIKKDATRPLSFEEIAELLQLKDAEAVEHLESILVKMVQTGQLVKTRTDRYGLPAQLNLIVGRLKKNRKGFGFLVSQNPDQEDLFIPSGDLNGAMNQDQVIVRIRKPAEMNELTGVNYRAEGQVIRILERYREKFVGTLKKSKHFFYVHPDDPLFGGDIFIPDKAVNGAKIGDKVMVQIKSWPDTQHSAEGIVDEIIGHQDDTGMDILSIVFKHGLSPVFPKKVQRLAKDVRQEVEPEEIRNRHDLRPRMMITIDGADAKDLDDAVYVEKLDNGNFILIVAIADVAAYVDEDGILDVEAYKRGTSVYLPDRVLPMLPEELSNGICSLKAGEDRLVICCFMEIDPTGVVVTSEIFEAVINVAYRMTYDDVNRIIEGDRALTNRYAMLLEMIEDMQDLRGALHRKRVKRGAIEFDIPESTVRLDKQGKPIEVYWRTRGIAETIIEEFMLVANETVAERYFWLKVPFIYRVHEKPDAESLAHVQDYLAVLGHTMNVKDDDNVQPRDYQKVLNEISGEKAAYPVSMVMLRSMNHAYYSEHCKGHFGLATRYYTHFTSPIRRYSDLAIHRIIKEMLSRNNHLTPKRIESLNERVGRYSEQISNAERIAEEAERDSIDLKKVEYMADHLYEVYTGTIVGITGFGLFVQLPNSIEGLVHISTLLDDFYQFDPKAVQLVGEHTRTVYKLGQEVQVQVSRVNVEEAKLDFALITEQNEVKTPEQFAVEKPKETKQTIDKKPKKKKHKKRR